MADVIRMPRLSDTMEEGVIKSWLKKQGDTVKPGDVMAEVETDKATMDLEAFQEGTLLYIAVKEGAVPVDGIIAIIGKPGEKYEHLLETKASSTPSASPATESAKDVEAVSPELKTEVSPTPEITKLESATQEVKTEVPADEGETSKRLKASPLAKSMAQNEGLTIEKIPGTGENGRIIKRDIEMAIEAKTAKGQGQSISPATLPKGNREVVVSQMRKTIAKRLSESKFSAPHFYLTTEVDMDACVTARSQLNDVSEFKISYNDIIVKACGFALVKNPMVNVSWHGDKMIFHSDIHIGIAVAIDDGLLVPVIKNVDQKTLSQIKLDIQDKAERARDKKLSLEEMQGNVFTISNLGMFDIEHFTAIINPPDSCILAVGSIVKKPAVKNDQIVVSHRMNLTLSCDHRAVDGATGAKFLQTLKSALENPISLLL
ncbi:MAG: 2-oxo acid dehydrogenase subunit E2 [Bacteroidota bacterium]|nr:2-oxo acid dehydrogenase subunit E2 [Bacteroidota bacterium]